MLKWCSSSFLSAVVFSSCGRQAYLLACVWNCYRYVSGRGASEILLYVTTNDTTVSPLYLHPNNRKRIQMFYQPFLCQTTRVNAPEWDGAYYGQVVLQTFLACTVQLNKYLGQLSNKQMFLMSLKVSHAVRKCRKTIHPLCACVQYANKFIVDDPVGLYCHPEIHHETISDLDMFPLIQTTISDSCKVITSASVGLL